MNQQKNNLIFKYCIVMMIEYQLHRTSTTNNQQKKKKKQKQNPIHFVQTADIMMIRNDYNSHTQIKLNNLNEIKSNPIPSKQYNNV